MRDIAKAFPDQCSWVQTFCSEGGGTVAKTTVGKFLKRLDYQDALQFLTMDLCIFGSVAKNVDPAVIEGVEPQIKKLRKELDRAGRPAHPAVVVDRVMASRRTQ